MEDRHALALERLAAHLGKPVGRSWLMNELFPGKSAAEVHGQFDALIRDVTAAAPALGLVLVCSSAPNGATTCTLYERGPGGRLHERKAATGGLSLFRRGTKQPS